MLDEFKIVVEIHDKLSRQLDFINDYLNDDVRTLLTNSHKLECKYEIPYLFHITRQYEGAYNKEYSYLVDFMEKKLDLYIKNSTNNNKVSVKFYDIKKLLFSVLYDNLEIGRFSLINKNYGYMYGTLHDKDSLNRMIERSNNQIVYNNEQIIEYLLEINKYKKFKDNYFNLFKEVKNIKGFFKLIFKSKEMKKAVDLFISRRENIVEELERQNEDEKINQKYYHKKFKENNVIANELNSMFNDLEYEFAKINNFYT